MKYKQNIKFCIVVIFSLFCRIFIRKRAGVLFNSFSGKYSDNPKYISLKLNELYPDVPIYWLFNEKNMRNNDIPEYINKVPIKGIIKKIYFGYKCKVVIDNFAGVRNFSKDTAFNRFITYAPKQIGISTWHGTPLKLIGHDYSKSVFSEPNISSAQYAIAGCKYTKEKLEQAYPFFDVIITGTPRNDILINNDYSVENLKERLKLPKKCKYVLFAPTYRNNDYESGIHQMDEIDFNKLSNILKEKFGGNWAFIYRLHPHINSIDIKRKYNNKFMPIFDGNDFEDMAEYLAVSDMLITDYSSSLFDYMLQDKPCVLLAMDREYYENSERGLYINMDKLPYPVVSDTAEMYTTIENLNICSMIEEKNLFLKHLGSAENGNASEKLVDMIIRCL